jgi:CRP-like cAMP-binding protein
MKKVLFILGQLSDSDVDWIARTGQRERHGKGTELIRFGVATSRLHFILDGEVAILTSKGFELARVGSGEILGEMSLVDSRPPSASAVVRQDAYVLSLDKAALGEKLEGDTAFAARFYRAIAIFLSERMRSTVGRMGYGDEAPDEAVDEDELDSGVLDNVHLAGARFDRLLQRLMG